jgi:tetratricopeptide (TPR) repeat protein
MSRAFVAIVLCSACARTLPGGLRCSAAGGPVWHEYRSRNFNVDTDLDTEEAAALVRELETLHAMVVRALVNEDREVPGRVRVVVPANDRTYAALAPPAVVGYFTRGQFEEPTAVIHPAALRSDPEIIAHELVHHLVWYFFPRRPTWFDEGIAQFLQTVANPDPRFHGDAGLVPRLRAPRLGEIAQMPAKEILAWRGEYSIYEADMGELWSWVLYHWLWTYRRDRLADYEFRLASGEDPAAAWVGAFPEFDPAKPGALKKLDEALDEHRRDDKISYYHVEVKPDTSFTSAALSSADVHMLLLAIRDNWRPPAGEYYSTALRADPAIASRKEIEEALREDPGNPVALWYSLRTHKPAAAIALRKSAAARPADWRSWYALSLVLRPREDHDEMLAALRKAVELNPDQAAVSNDLAALLLVDGHPKEALPFAQRAVELAPSHPVSLDTLAGIAWALNQCPQALQLEQRAVDLMLPKNAAAPRKRLQEYKQRCGSAR